MDKIKKIAGLIIAISAALSIVAGIFTYSFKTIYHEEIEKFEEAVEFSNYAQDTLVPLFVRELDELKGWKSEKSKTIAIGLRRDRATQEIWYRAGLDLKLYRAYYVPEYGAYYYSINGTQYECH